MFFVIAASVMHDSAVFMPPLRAAGAKAACGAVGLTLVLIGAGMLRRSRFAWYGLFAYLALGGVWSLALGICLAIAPPDDVSPGALFHFLRAVTAALLGVGLYHATWLVFRTGDESGDAPASDERTRT